MQSSRRVRATRDARRRLLLAAAVHRDERAPAAWARWSSTATPEQVEGADMRLLAPAYRNLTDLGVEDSSLALAKGIYRRTWYVNQLGVRRAGAVIAHLREAGIEALVLKGAALALIDYRDLGARPMGDVDLLVHPDEERAAVRALAPHGWRFMPEQREGPLRYGTHVEDAAGNEVDIHAYALMESVDDADMWDSAVAFDLLQVPARAPGPDARLLHVCVHGARWSENESGWAVDALAILRACGGSLDWDRLVERARARRLTVAAAEALAWLRASLEAPIPVSVPEQLLSGPRLRFERTLHRTAARPPTRWRLALFSWDRYRRFAALAPAERRPASFTDFLGRAWGVDGRVALVTHGARKLVPPRS